MSARAYPCSAIACLGASLLVACGGGESHRATRPHAHAAAAGARPAVGDRTDLRSPDVDARMDPVPSRAVFACPRAGHVDVCFYPHGSVALLAGGRPLVYRTVGTPGGNRGCPTQGSL